ncbi:MAG TPA: 3-deoxy-8-phosphooctulonate synthase, partial [Nitrospiria bacterium]|nr:3-deoxy-8-phosphooctulonate synthase [Nitrospiria bacterium]
LFLIAGPCVIEGEDLVLKVSDRIFRMTSSLGIPYVFKSSYDKANRSSIRSFRGIGMEEGLRILEKVREKIGVPVLSDVHTAEEARAAGQVLDVHQIPAFLCRQTDLLLAAGKTGKTVNVKKGQFLAPWEMKNVVEKLESTGNHKILLTERGTTFGYNNLVSDMRSIPIMKRFGYPVVFDGTHSVQLPGGGGTVSSGQREFVAPLSRAAVAAGCDGLFWEVHPDPDSAPSDGPNMLNFEQAERLLAEVHRIARALGGNDR